MRKLLVVLASVFLLSAGAAFAQDEDVAIDTAGDTWVGVSTGYPLGLTAHYGLGDALGDGVDLRFNGRFSFANAVGVSSFGFNVGADALFNIPVEGENLNVYAGAGPSLGFTVTSSNVIGGGSVGGFTLGAQGLAGAEYLVDPQIGLFGELRVGFSYVTGLTFDFAPTLALGANYHF